MRLSWEGKRRLGKASVSLLAIALMTFGPMAAAYAQSEMDELMGAAAEKVSNAELGEQRGGFYVKGMRFHIAVERHRTVNGELAYSSHLVADEDGWHETIYDAAMKGGEAASEAAHHGAETAAAAATSAYGEGTPPHTGDSSATSATPPSPQDDPLPSLSDPVAAIDSGAPAPTNDAALDSGATQSAAQASFDATTTILGGVELVVDAVTPPEAQGSSAATASPAPVAPDAPEVALAAPEASAVAGTILPAIPETSLGDAAATGLPAQGLAGDLPSSAGQTNTDSSSTPEIAEAPASAGPSVLPASPGPQNVQVLAGGQPLTNETVRRMLFGPTVVINDESNVVIQEYSSITIDISNFSHLTRDALRGQIAASIADLIRAQTVNALSGF